MFICRLRPILKLKKQTTLVGSDFACKNVSSNLKSAGATSRNLSVSARPAPLTISKVGKWTSGEKKGMKIMTRLLQIEDANIANEERNLSENAVARNVIASSTTRQLKTFAQPLEKHEFPSDDRVKMILENDWKNCSVEEILQAFYELSCRGMRDSLSLDSPEYEPIMRKLAEKLAGLDDQQLRKLFQCLCCWARPEYLSSEAFLYLYGELDKECVRRLPKWSAEELLIVGDFWYKLRLARKVGYSKLMLQKLGRNPRRLNPDNFLHFLFMINVNRRPEINMYEVEYRLDSILQEYSINELGIVAMAFFKTQTPFRDESIVTRMLLKMSEDIYAPNDVAISAIMKMTRYSTRLKSFDILKETLEKLIPRIPELTIACLTNTLHAAAYVQYLDRELLEKTIEKFESCMDDARIKDLERLCWVLSIFDYDPKSPIFSKIIESFRDPRRKDEIEQYKTIVPTALAHLSNLNIHALDLARHFLDPEILMGIHKGNLFKIGWDYFTLENNLMIDVPEYDGPFLQPKVRQFLSKNFISSKFRSKTKRGQAEQFTTEVAHLCKVVLNSEKSIFIDQVLPHYVKSDIIICLDENNNPVDPEPILSKIPFGTIKRREPDGLKWIAVILAGQNQLIKPVHNYVGAVKCKIRQLEKIGYHPIVINHLDFRIHSGLDAKECFIRKKLREEFVVSPNASSAVL